ncbi:MAG: trigger factor [Nitrospirae bacterium]|nr:MAG: trigger factor [Nitrospirota bacterium]
MKLEMTELGPVKRSLKIEVPEDVVNEEFHKVYRQLQRQVRIPGFRPGKAPVALLEKRYAREVEQDVVQRLVPNYYERAIKEAGVEPVVVEIPPIERLKVRRNMPFTFTATIEIKPRIELGDYRPPNPISLKRDTRTVTDEQVDRALQTLREQHGQLDAAPEEAAIEEGMYAVVSINAFLDSTPIEGAAKAGELVKVGAGTPILGIVVDDHLLGKRRGESVDIPQTYPPQHPDERLAGKTVIFRVQIDAIKRQTLPELDDEFAKDCGDYQSLEDLRVHIRTQLEEILKRDIEEGYKEQIIERLIQMHHFEIPEPLIDRELQAMVRQKMLREHGHHKHEHGMDALEEPLKLQEEAKRLQHELYPEAKRRVKLSLILEAIAEREGLTVDENDFEEEIKRLAKSLKLGVEEVRRIIDAGGPASREEFKDRILADKALQFVYQCAVVQG